ncbi:MAG: DUF4198 domain-containing protein [Rhodospirillaceae bacterium]|nr:DUF4198 domain-containing protein [Rhodospirillales bacterium]
MLRRLLAAAAVLLMPTLAPSLARAHFQEIIPAADILADNGDRMIRLALSFTHPMERGPVMEMAPPVRFGVMAGGKVQDLKGVLTPVKRDGKTAFEAATKANAPGDYVFFVEPAPYWEAAEGKYIVQLAKVVVDFGAGTGWDQMVGLPVEIEPLVRPYGLWTGSQFRGIVRKNGKPLPFTLMEVEWRNDGSVTAPSDPFVTQIIKTDGAGQFSFTMPRAGWWGFAALTEGAPRPGPNGKPAPVELGAVMWVKTQDMK